MGKLHRVRSDGETIISQTAHGEFTRNMRPPDKGGQRERGGTNHLYFVLHHDASGSEVPGSGMPAVLHNAGRQQEIFMF